MLCQRSNSEARHVCEAELVWFVHESGFHVVNGQKQDFCTTAFITGCPEWLTFMDSVLIGTTSYLESFQEVSTSLKITYWRSTVSTQ